MFHATRLFLGAAIVLIGGGVLAQGPKSPDADGYFPLKSKTKWTYKVQDQTIEVVVSNTDKAPAGGDELTKVDTLVNGKVVASETYMIRVDGVYRVKVKDDKIDPPVMILKIPAKQGDSWEIKSKVGTQTVSGTFKVKDTKEKINVMGKDAEAIVVEGDNLDVAGTKTTVRTWFVKGVGVVRLSYKIQDAESTLELTKFEEAPKGSN